MLKALTKNSLNACVLISAVSLLAACGGGGSDVTPAQSSSPAPAAMVATPPAPAAVSAPAPAPASSTVGKTVQGATFSQTSAVLRRVLSTGQNDAAQIVISDLLPQAGKDKPYKQVDESGRATWTVISTLNSTTQVYDQVTMMLSVKPSVAAGMYSGEISVYVCKDASCSVFESDLPAKLPYSMTVTP